VIRFLTTPSLIQQKQTYYLDSTTGSHIEKEVISTTTKIYDGNVDPMTMRPDSLGINNRKEGR